MDATPEEWRPVVGYEEFYEVSNKGRVRSHDRYSPNGVGVPILHRGRMRKLSVMKSGHHQITLNRHGEQAHRLVHHLVLEAFVCPRPEGLEGCHANGIPGDNRVENLRWDTRSENNLDRVRHGEHAMANKAHCPQGHEYTPENTRILKTRHEVRGRRSCLTCERARGRAYYHRVVKPKREGLK